MSQQRRCDIWKATDSKWYMRLGDFEYAEERGDCTCYGPFESMEEVDKELDRHSNPGGSNINESGTKPPPDPAVDKIQPKHRTAFGSTYRY
jgi:hypothetical protein